MTRTFDRDWIIPDSVYYVESFLPGPVADSLLKRLRDETPWEQHEVSLFGRPVKCPRLSAWYGDPDAVYSYSGSTHAPRPWTPELSDLRSRLGDAVGVQFNSVLLNLYRSGSDSMGWHADDEPELGERPLIASISLGAVRRFRLKRRPARREREEGPDQAPSMNTPDPVSIELGHGSLLVMRGACQKEWKHALPKTSRDVGPRINLTYRRIGPVAA